MTTELEKPDVNAEELHAGQTMTPAEEEQNSAQPAAKLSREEIIEALRKLVEGHPMNRRKLSNRCWLFSGRKRPSIPPRSRSNARKIWLASSRFWKR